MNTEKAIDLLDNLIGMVDDNQGSDYNAAFHMAIDALKAQAERTEERTETHGVCLDAIDRQAAIDVLDRNHILGQGLLNDTLDHIADAIMALSSAQPQRTGRWIDHVEDGYVECPFCHSATNCDDNISDLHFCFSCGTRMEGGQE